MDGAPRNIHQKQSVQQKRSMLNAFELSSFHASGSSSEGSVCRETKHKQGVKQQTRIINYIHNCYLLVLVGA
jgi:hypothetical protein